MIDTERRAITTEEQASAFIKKYTAFLRQPAADNKPAAPNGTRKKAARSSDNGVGKKAARSSGKGTMKKTPRSSKR
jgi:hypothetical protein